MNATEEPNIILNPGLGGDEYPIILYDPSLGLEVIEENRLVHSFSELEEMLKFCGSLDISFMMILPKDLASEERVLKELKNLKDIYKRRLTDFEEESVIMRIFNGISTEKSFKVYVFYTKRDFEDEVLTKESVDKVVRLGEVKEIKAAKEFAEEYISWETNKTAEEKHLYHPQDFHINKENPIENDYLERKEFCIRNLNELVFKRKREKIKMICFVTLAESQGYLYENKESLEIYEKVLDVFQEIHGEDHPSTASLYDRLAMSYSFLDQDDQRAFDYQTKALNTRKSIYGEMHSFTAGSYNRLGLMYKSQGEHQKALEHYLKALEIFQEIYGEIHPATATLYGNIGNIYGTFGEHQKTLEYNLKALEVKKAVYGETDPVMVAFALHGLAHAYKKLKEDQKMFECYLEAIEIMKAAKDNRERVPCGAYLYRDFGFLCWHSKDYQNAFECVQKALDIFIFVYGESHQSVLSLLGSLGTMYQDLGESQQALEYYSKALQVARSIYGEIHSKTQIYYNSLAEVYMHLGEWKKALECLAKSFSIKACLYGEMNLETADEFHGLARVAEYVDEYAQAFHYYLKSLNIYRVVLGEEDARTEAVYEDVWRAQSMLEKEQKEFIYDKKARVLKGYKGIVEEEEGLETDKKTFSVSKGQDDDSLLEKRRLDLEGSQSENPEGDVEKKIKQ